MATRTDARPIADSELLIRRTFDAPAALVFRIWEDESQRIRWWGPKEFRCTTFEHDFRIGGKWRAHIESPRLQTWMGGEYRVIERNKRLIFTFAWADHPDQPKDQTLVTVDFHEEDGRTIQTFHQSPFAKVETRDSHIGGWQSLFDVQETYLKNL
jgi:uncharacterized protein YndB with AHSA1/START domain